MNGLFTVAGGFAAILISMGYGFSVAIGVALFLYAVAFGVFPRLQKLPDTAIAA